MKGSFFCEACGAEVKSLAESCPSCGRSFLGVRCPRCGREGSPEVFKDGCPECGYMEERETGINGSPGDPGTVELDEWPIKDWPASRYWVLSAMVVLGVGLILYFWLR